ncbi:MAG: energy-coupling factor transporter transmembrane protein EcfT, partial [Varibaculum cambriense]|nr:energy-coupling factor transporter transmembrane protein EcfT [Varibaculum cambriense]
MSLQCQTSAPGSAASYHQDQVTSAEILAANQRHSRPDPRTVILVIFVLNALVMSRLPIVITFLVAGIALFALLLSPCYSWALGFLAVEGTWVACIYL